MKTTKEDLTDIYSEIREMIGTITKLSANVNNIQVVRDFGTLVENLYFACGMIKNIENYVDNPVSIIKLSAQKEVFDIFKEYTTRNSDECFLEFLSNFLAENYTDKDNAKSIIDKCIIFHDDYHDNYTYLSALAKNKDEMEDEMGDILFAVVNLARWHKLDAEQCLLSANRKFTKRFKYMEENSKKPLENLTFEEWENLWNEAKKN